jgi:putative transposase
MTDAYHAGSALEAEAALLALAKELDRTYPGAAAGLREGLDDTLTVLRLNVAPTLARTLRSTNCIESRSRSAATTPPTSSAGATGRWRCAGARPEWSRPASNSAGSTVTCTCRHSARRSSASPPNLSAP